MNQQSGTQTDTAKDTHTPTHTDDFRDVPVSQRWEVGEWGGVVWSKKRKLKKGFGDFQPLVLF